MSVLINVKVTTPLEPDVFEFEWLSGREAVSDEYSFDLGLTAQDLDIAAVDLLGLPVTVSLGTPEGERHFTGLVSRFCMSHFARGQAHYKLTFRPWSWFLSHRFDCRIFQHKNVLDIVQEVLGEHPAAAIDDRTSATYPERDYTVQFGESDLDFAKRLLEDEGIFYFFETGSGEATLVLSDDIGALDPAPGYETVNYNPEGSELLEDVDTIQHWHCQSAVVSGAVAHTNYDFMNPGTNLMTTQANPLGYDGDDPEVYRYPEAHLDVGRGETIATTRQQELQAPHRRVTAKGRVRGLYAGAVFAFAEYARAAENGDYFVVAAQFNLSADGTTEQDHFGVFELQPAELAFRPARRTPRPVMKGPHTATVVGPDGEEIYTDEWSRVKVHFHWDRLGPSGETTSCFVRVASVWAGSGWGFLQVPRIGEEVIVDFIDGDPDRPLITGRVYNAAQMPPFPLPGNKTQSGVMTKSSPGGGGENILRFEDKAGNEEIYMQAQKDLNELIKNNEGRTIQNDFTETVENNATQTVVGVRSETVNGTKDVTVDGDRTVVLNSNDSETVASDRSLTVGGNEVIGVSGNSNETISGSHSQSVTGSQTITATGPRIVNAAATETVNVAAAQSINVLGGRSVVVVGGEMHTISGADGWGVSGAQTINIGGAQTMGIGGGQTFNVGGDQGFTVTGSKSVSVGGTYGLQVTGKMGLKTDADGKIEAAGKLELKCGSAKIVLESGGKITLDGSEIILKSSGKIGLDAGGDIIGNGSTISLN
ncbi:MAG: type VI secretion system tip protein TssI/VgrG [Paracoccaceae bacterium]|nr:type VI secretion system tip protein TssI/VgrG [Paracoccaceae bacterium]